MSQCLHSNRKYSVDLLKHWIFWCFSIFDIIVCLCSATMKFPVILSPFWILEKIALYALWWLHYTPWEDHDTTTNNTETIQRIKKTPTESSDKRATIDVVPIPKDIFLHSQNVLLCVEETQMVTVTLKSMITVSHIQYTVELCIILASSLHNVSWR